MRFAGCVILLAACSAAAAAAGEEAPVQSRITVTATRGSEQNDTEAAPHVVVKERTRVFERPTQTVGNAFDAEPGILVQQTTAGQVSPFLRGLTGYQVLNLVDGVRFNNTTFRSGPNQYLVFVEPSQARRVEAMLGPSGAQYGSDALGGTINVITGPARFNPDKGWHSHGEASLFGASADWSSGGNVQASVANDRLFWLLGASGRRHGDLRPGGGDGVDSRNVYRRLFGLSDGQIRGFAGSRQQDSGFRQYGVNTKFALRPSAGQTLLFWYQRGVLDGVRGYKDLLGGLGRVQSDFDPQALDFFYTRYEKSRAGGLIDTISGTFSLNQQTDGSARRNLRYTDPLTADWSRVRSYGYSVQATTHKSTAAAAVLGADIYDEHVASTRRIDGAPARPLYPDGSRYTTYGVFGQGTADLIPSRLRLGLGGRWTQVQYASLAFRDLTYNASLSYQATPWLAATFLAGRGFRAPNLNDLGALGLNDLGYEIPAAEAAGAILSDSAGEGAVSLGRPVSALRPESLHNYEAGIRVTARRFYGRVHLFDAELGDPIVRRTLLFPAAAVPAQLAGIAVSPITPSPAQRGQGVVTVAATGLDPRAIKAFVNDGQSRYYGIESMLRWAMTVRWSAEANYAFLVGRDLNPNRHIRRLPPQMAAASLRYAAPRRRYWIEWAASAAGTQRRLSGGDVDDERIGASRRRRDIADFFAGSRVAPLLDGAGRFTPTGETLRQIQDRVLPGLDDNLRVPLYGSTAGWVTAAVRAGVPVGERMTIHAAIENLADRQYRLHGSGIDAAGRNAYVGFRYLW
jgi:outer membrane receptor protein involved in Fe transport